MPVTNKTKTPFSARDLWQTDPRVVKWMERYFGIKFELDVCGSPFNRKAPKVCINCPSLRHDTKQLENLGIYWDGLNQPWHQMAKTAFMNPPFSAKEKWIAKAEQESRLGITVYGLAPIALATNWWRSMEQGAKKIAVPDKRINYINPMTDKILNGVSFETSIPIWEESRDVHIERVRIEI